MIPPETFILILILIEVWSIFVSSSFNVTKKSIYFQVVPVPGVFTRGRWRCVDYHDENPPAELIDSISKFTEAQREALEAAEAIQKGLLFFKI